MTILRDEAQSTLQNTLKVVNDVVDEVGYFGSEEKSIFVKSSERLPTYIPYTTFISPFLTSALDRCEKARSARSR